MPSRGQARPRTTGRLLPSQQPGSLDARTHSPSAWWTLNQTDPAHRTARRLLVVTTGNITNNDLLALVKANLAAIVASFDEAAFVELGPDRLIVHH